MKFRPAEKTRRKLAERRMENSRIPGEDVTMSSRELINDNNDSGLGALQMPDQNGRIAFKFH